MNKRDSKQELSVKSRVCPTVVSAKKKNKAELEDGMPLGFGERKEH